MLPLEKLRCPRCHAGSEGLVQKPEGWHCEPCGAGYPLLGGRPVLIRPDDPVFPPAAYRRRAAAPRAAGPEPRRRFRLARFVPGLSANLSAERCLAALGERVERRGGGEILVVGAGSQRAALEARLARFPRTRLCLCDVDADAAVDLFCDAHELPFRDASFAGVIATAVLEHVLHPERAAAEIARVLAPKGLLYSELPFLQQVHEGAHDVTRYTMVGHRGLFAGFEILESGMVAGPGTTLGWAIEGFGVAFVAAPRARAAVKTIVRLLFFWLKYLDRWLEHAPAGLDGASCTYLLAEKAERCVGDDEILAGYSGAQRVRHV